MWRQGNLFFTLVFTVLCLAIAGCGGDDDGSDSSTDREEEAQQVVTDLIAAFQSEDFEAACELQTQLVNDSIQDLGKSESCAAGYEELFKKQGDFSEQSEDPFDQFIASLDDYEVGEATLEGEEGSLTGQVLLEGPEEAASLVQEEDGAIKVSELFVTPDANTDPGSATP